MKNAGSICINLQIFPIIVFCMNHTKERSFFGIYGRDFKHLHKGKKACYIVQFCEKIGCLQ